MANFVITGPGSNFVGVGDASSFASKIIDVSPLIANQLPSFVRSDHPTFVAFLEAYYEWLEREAQAIFEAKSIINNQDIDMTVDSFVSWFSKEFLAQIPQNILADRRLLVKNIKDLYRSRGSEKSYKLLFRILYDKDVDFYYPSRDILRASDGKWIQDKSMRISIVDGDPFDLVSKKIVGVLTGASAVVERVVKLQGTNYETYELFFAPRSFVGTFSITENVQTEDQEIVGYVYPVISGITITNGGSDYTVGEIITFTDTRGAGAQARVKSVDANGAIRFVEILNPGVNYSNSPTAVFPASTITATGTPIVSAVSMYPGYYLNEDGHLDTTKFLQDNYYYQQFSYVVLVDESLNFYRDAVKKILHPCGLILFGGVQVVDLVDMQMKLADGVGSGIDITIFIEEYLNLQLNQEIHGAGLSRQLISIIRFSDVPDESYGFLGPSLRSLERQKFNYLPSDLFPDENGNFPPPNENYWLAYGNTQIKDIEHFTLGDVIERPYTKINLCADPYLAIRMITDSLYDDFDAITLTADYDPHVDQAGIISGRYDILVDQRVLADNLDAVSSGLRPWATREDNSENLLLYSKDFSNAVWSKLNCSVTTDVIVDPLNGTLTADMLVENSATDVERSVSVSNSIRYIPGQSYVFSGFVKSAGRRYVRIEFDSAAEVNSYATYDLDTGDVVLGIGVESATAVAYSPGWIKFEVTFSPSNNVLGDAKVYMSSSPSDMTYDGDGTSGIYLWGLQIRDARADSTYVDTTDLVQYRGIGGKKSMKFLGGQEFQTTSPLSDYVTNSAQTCWVVFSADDVTNKGVLLADTNNDWSLYVESGELRFTVDDGTPSTAALPIDAGETYIAKIEHRDGYISLSVDDGFEVRVASGNIASLAGTLEVGRSAGADGFHGTIARMIFDNAAQSTLDQVTILNLLNLLYRAY